MRQISPVLWPKVGWRYRCSTHGSQHQFYLDPVTAPVALHPLTSVTSESSRKNPMHPSKRFQPMRPAFTAPVPLSLAPVSHPNVSTIHPPRMAVDPDTVGTGYALLNNLKGVVIGPTINEITAAIAGGTVGVMGTIITLEVRRQRAKERKQCPYCRGTGNLPCGRCYTLGAVPSGHSLTAQEECSACLSKGYLQCNHCQGDGRLIPFLYERAIRAQYEDYVYTSNDGYYDDTPPHI